LLAGLALCAVAGTASAQTPPTAREIAAYQGLHAAAASGDATTIRRRARAGAEVNGRDAAGRTPLHVAAFLARRDAMRALAEAGAD
ncbi:ankyrin repeat domain-containing protein, partial [Klebsiella aerogenes]|uniref:ankyrin repeat domain-containing protein n=1 Tax=Klebsiella aerogenes TaxID=548 RepID=UPI001953E180